MEMKWLLLVAVLALGLYEAARAHNARRDSARQQRRTHHARRNGVKQVMRAVYEEAKRDA